MLIFEQAKVFFYLNYNQRFVADDTHCIKFILIFNLSISKFYCLLPQSFNKFSTT